MLLLKSSILASFRLDTSFWVVLSATAEQLRRGANMVDQALGKFDQERLERFIKSVFRR